MNNISDKIKSSAEKVDIFLKNYFLKKNTQNSLFEAMNYGLFSGGKKIRSYITKCAFEIYKIDEYKYIPIAGAIECVHSYSLIHDDLPSMDNDDFRRGKESTHKKFGEANAILAGNSLLTSAFEIISSDNLRIDHERKSNLTNSLALCAGHEGIAGGQYLDLKYENEQKDEKEIINMQIKKTGELMGFCCESAAIVAGAVDDRENLRKAGLNLGLLFQISDDLLDIYGDPNILGKPTQQDDKKGKATIMTIKDENQSNKMCIDIQSKIKELLYSHGDSERTLLECADYIFKRDH